MDWWLKKVSNMSAKEMFEELGYEYYEEDNCIECIISDCVPNRINTETISFIKIKFYDKHIYIESYETDAYLSNRKNYDTTLFSTYELKAINKQVEELGWNNE